MGGGGGGTGEGAAVEGGLGDRGREAVGAADEEGDDALPARGGALHALREGLAREHAAAYLEGDHRRAGGGLEEGRLELRRKPDLALRLRRRHDARERGTGKGVEIGRSVFRRGVPAWTFEAAPGEAKEIKLGWRLRWPGDKVVAYEPRRP